MRGFAAVVLGVLLQAAAAWRVWPHVGEGPAKWKRNWMPMEQQNDTYFEGTTTLTRLRRLPYRARVKIFYLCQSTVAILR